MPRRRLSLALRVVSLVLLAVVIGLTGRDEGPRKSTLVLVFDDTATRAENGAPERLLPGRLSDRDGIEIQRGVSPARLPDAISRRLREDGVGEESRFLVVSDGRWPPDMQPLARQLQGAGRPLAWLPLRAEGGRPAIRGVSAPRFAEPGEAFEVTLGIAAEGRVPVDVDLIADGRAVGRQRLGPRGSAVFTLRAPASGSVVFGAELRAGDTGESIDRLDAIGAVTVLEPPEVWVLSVGTSLIADSLRRGGWRVTETMPGSIAARLDALHAVSALIVDDIPGGALPAGAWAAIVDQVRRNALGLVVLGGPRSFGRGAYRGSMLESVLPVLSEPPADQQKLGLMFMVDVSGSMDRGGFAGSRLAMARQAVLETAADLRPVDRVGLMSFNVSDEVVLPLASRADHMIAIREAWPSRAAGGTDLSHSLRRALEQMAAEPDGQNLLLVLTDGFLADADLVGIDALLADSDVEVIALVMMDSERSPEPALFQILERNGGKGVRVDDILRLPDIARSEFEARRPAIIEGRSSAHVDIQTAWLGGGDRLPDVDGYSLTRPRTEAVVYVSSATGDPLIAGAQAGAGRVLAIMPGLSSWAPRWSSWENWPEFAAGLVGFVAAHASSANRIELQDRDTGDATVTVELADRAYSGSLTLRLTDPNGRTLDTEPGLVAPGRYEAVLDELSGDRFEAVLASDGAVHRQTLVRSRLAARTEDSPALALLLAAEGTVELSDGTLPANWSADLAIAEYLALAALTLFLVALVVERVVTRWPIDRTCPGLVDT